MSHEKIKHIDLFSGIGGFALAVDRVFGEAEHIFCDNDPFAQAILKKHWPQAPIHGDIKELRNTGSAHILTGGFPCQPFSAAGLRLGKEDDRHLWPEMLRIIREATPEWVLGENVSGLLTWNGGMVLDDIFADLEAEGYEVWAFVIPAVAVNAPHRRDRVWITAHRHGGHLDLPIQPQKGRRQSENSDTQRKDSRFSTSDTKSLGLGGRGSEERGAKKRIVVSAQQGGHAPRHQDERRDWSNWHEAAAQLCTLDDGLPNGLARPRGWRNAGLKAAGNSIVPQIAELIIREMNIIT